MTSNANTSGLEVVDLNGLLHQAWERLHRSDADVPGALVVLNALHVALGEPLITAASAQARIAELSVSMTQQSDQWSERLLVMADRATAAEAALLESQQATYAERQCTIEENRLRLAAEARADRLAKALEPFASLALDEANDVKGVSMSDPISKWLTVAQLVDARAALQQEG